MPTSDSTIAAMTSARPAIPGTAYQRSQQPATPSTEKPSTHGLRGPVASAMAPSTGDISAMISPPAPAA